MIQHVGNVLQPVGNYPAYALTAASRGGWPYPVDFPLPVTERLPAGTTAQPQPANFYEAPPVEAPTMLSASPKAYAPNTQLVEAPTLKAAGRPLYRSGTTLVVDKPQLPLTGRGAAASSVTALHPTADAFGALPPAPFGVPWWAVAAAGVGLWWMMSRKGRR